MISRLDSIDKKIRFSQSTKKTNIARYLLIWWCILHSVQSKTLLYYQAMPAVPQTQRAFLLPTSVQLERLLLAAEATFPISGTIQTLTAGWCRSESTEVAAQWSSPPRQQKEVHHLGEKKREYPSYTNWKCPATPYCQQLQICMGSHGANQLGLAIAAMHTLLFKNRSGFRGHLQALLLQHLFPSQSWRCFPQSNTTAKRSSFPHSPCGSICKIPLLSCRRLMAKIITERVSMYKEWTTP